MLRITYVCLILFVVQQERRVSSHLQRMGGINAMAFASNQQIVLSVGQEKKISYVFEDVVLNVVCLDFVRQGFFSCVPFCF